MAKKKPGKRKVVGTQPSGRIVREVSKKQQAENKRQLGGRSKRSQKGYYP